MRHAHSFLLVTLLLMLSALTDQAHAQNTQGFTRGINLSHWHAQVYDPRGYVNEYFFTRVDAKDARLIASLGFDHVRISVEPAGLFNDAEPGVLNPSRLRALDIGIRQMLDAGLNVILDIHPGDAFKHRLIEEPEAREAFITNWVAFAQHYKAISHQRIWFELLNEPLEYPQDEWRTFQTRVARAVRDTAPQHTIVLAADRWSGLEELLTFDPIDMQNVVYNFHCYDPFIFTHQGANWAGPVLEPLRLVPYPSSPERVKPLIERTDDPQTIDWLTDYGAKRWDAAILMEHIGRAGAWAREHNVPIICNEFGTYLRYSKAEERIQWTHDIRVALEHNGIGWTMWDYQGGFAVVDENDRPNFALVQALGLKRK